MDDLGSRLEVGLDEQEEEYDFERTYRTEDDNPPPPKQRSKYYDARQTLRPFRKR